MSRPITLTEDEIRERFASVAKRFSSEGTFMTPYQWGRQGVGMFKRKATGRRVRDSDVLKPKAVLVRILKEMGVAESEDDAVAVLDALCTQNMDYSGESFLGLGKVEGPNGEEGYSIHLRDRPLE